MSAIVNNYKRPRRYALRKRATQEWLCKSHRDVIFFTTGKTPSPIFNSIEEVHRFINDQIVILERSIHLRYNSGYYSITDENTDGEIVPRTESYVFGEDFEVVFYTLKEFTLFCYDVDKTVDYEIVTLNDNKRINKNGSSNK